MVENVNSHMYMLPNVERIFSAKAFSSLSLLTNLKKLSAVWPNAVHIVHYYQQILCLF